MLPPGSSGTAGDRRDRTYADDRSRAVRTTLGRADWRAFQRHAGGHVVVRARAINLVFVAFALSAAVAIGLGLGMQQSTSQTPPAAQLLLGIGALMLLLGMVVMVAGRRWFLHRWWDLTSGRYELASTISGASIRRKGQTVEFTWESVIGWSEDQDRFYLSVAPYVGWPLPKRDFGSEDDVDLLRMLLVDAERRTP